MKIFYEKKFPLNVEVGSTVTFDIWDESKEHLGATQPDTMIISGMLGGSYSVTLTSGAGATDLTGIKLESLAKGVVGDTISEDYITLDGANVYPFGPIAYDVTGAYNGEYTFTYTQTADDASQEGLEAAYLYVKVLYED